MIAKDIKMLKIAQKRFFWKKVLRLAKKKEKKKEKKHKKKKCHYKKMKTELRSCFLNANLKFIQPVPLRYPYHMPLKLGF